MLLSTSNASFNVYGTGGGGRGGSRYMTGNSKAVSQAVGDIIILHDGNVPFTTLVGIVDCNGLVKLIRSVIKQRLDSFER